MENPPTWTADYLDREWKPPYGCFFLVADVLRDHFGIIDIPDYSNHELLSEGHDSYQRRALVIQEVLDNRCYIVEGKAEAGDVIVIAAGENPIHVGIVVADNWFLHCTDGINTTLSRLDDLLYRNRIKSYNRVSSI